MHNVSKVNILKFTFLDTVKLRIEVGPRIDAGPHIQAGGLIHIYQ